MSLLLEALKRAERQRQEPPPPPPRPPEEETPPAPPVAEPEPAPAAAEPVMTLEPLPEQKTAPTEAEESLPINRDIEPPPSVASPPPAELPPLELSLADIPPPAAPIPEAIPSPPEQPPHPQAREPSISLAPEPLPAEPATPPAPPPAQADRVEPTPRGEAIPPAKPAPTPFANPDQRERVRTLLGASQAPAKLSPQRKRQLALGGIALVVALGTAGALFWLDQQTSPSPIALPPPSERPAEAAPPSPEENAPATPAAVENAEPPREEPPPPKAVKTEERDAPPAPLSSNSRPRAATEPSVPLSPRPAPSPVSIRRNDTVIIVHPATAAGYAALSSGNLGTARQQYQEALKSDQRSRDAILGLAVTALREGHAEEAARRYQQLLDLDPRDADANAGLALLRGAADPVTFESRLRVLIEERGDNAALHHALGSLLARQNRWGEAQEAFFRAVTLAPRAADYLFNLAVALDHLGQYAQARTYYRKALEQSSGNGTFDRNAAQARLASIEAQTP
ncbi:MAG TPA: tetratricopeptide repeat protein [Rhodocyclaceae bacterium]|nr:tetratricopeptide repeat protein [Rhodocyclaceae bacterium]